MTFPLTILYAMLQIFIFVNSQMLIEFSSHLVTMFESPKLSGLNKISKRKTTFVILTFVWNVRSKIEQLFCQKSTAQIRPHFSVTRLGDLLDFEQLFKAWATVSLPKSPTFLGNFCKKVSKIFNFSSEIIFGQLLKIFGDFLMVTLLICHLVKEVSRYRLKCTGDPF